MKKYVQPALWIIGYQAIAYGIGLATRANMEWYDTLAKSALTPPDIAFPIVWTVLYVFLALAGYRVWNKRKEAFPVFISYWVQMALNWGWSFVFFAGHLIFLGFIWIVVFDIAMLSFIVLAWKNDMKVPALLVLPTLLWGSFAGYLNYAIWTLN